MTSKPPVLYQFPTSSKVNAFAPSKVSGQGVGKRNAQSKARTHRGDTHTATRKSPDELPRPMESARTNEYRPSFDSRSTSRSSRRTKTGRLGWCTGHVYGSRARLTSKGAAFKIMEGHLYHSTKLSISDHTTHEKEENKTKHRFRSFCELSLLPEHSGRLASCPDFRNIAKRRRSFTGPSNHSKSSTL